MWIWWGYIHISRRSLSNRAVVGEYSMKLTLIQFLYLLSDRNTLVVVVFIASFPVTYIKQCNKFKTLFWSFTLTVQQSIPYSILLKNSSPNWFVNHPHIPSALSSSLYRVKSTHTNLIRFSLFWILIMMMMMLKLCLYFHYLINVSLYRYVDQRCFCLLIVI